MKNEMKIISEHPFLPLCLARGPAQVENK